MLAVFMMVASTTPLKFVNRSAAMQRSCEGVLGAGFRRKADGTIVSANIGDEWRPGTTAREMGAREMGSGGTM
ncbi:hypothetical protein I302_105570 [Kwoniella bestiolae CBS 10118]|uniref:Uncharacterized protein n=1 Tax=Kwoniella bestiolae CBS 10118 TaxID=1296100 RepID=A0AAJ8MAE8_9TREE